MGTSLIFTPAIAVIAHYFSRRRGLATGLATTSGSIGGIIFPLALPQLFSSLGWTWAIRVMGFVFIALVLVANCLIRSRLPPKVGGSVWPDFCIFRNFDFAMTTAGVYFMEWGLFIPIAFIPSWALQTHAGSPEFAFQLLGILNVGSFFGRWLPGFIADKAGRFNTMIGSMILCLLFILALWLPGSLAGSGGMGNVPLATIFALGFGLGSGSNISLAPVCIGQLCKTEEYGRYYATCYTIVSMGCLTGVPIAGALLRIGGGKFGGLIAFNAACYAAGLACYVVVRVHKVGWKLMAVY